MKLELLYLKGKPHNWADLANAEYEAKINHFFPFKRTAVKSKSSDREGAVEKVKAESDAIFSNIKETDVVILFDENGKEFSDSISFSKELIRNVELPSKRILFIIGGPYGFSKELKTRANKSWSMGKLTMNHHVAQLAAMEQIYRGFTIWKGLPYHNV